MANSLVCQHSLTEMEMYLIFLATVLLEISEVFILPFPSQEKYRRSWQNPGHKQVLILSTVSLPSFSLPWSMPL